MSDVNLILSKIKKLRQLLLPEFTFNIFSRRDILGKFYFRAVITALKASGWFIAKSAKALRFN